ncbi:hypothetical protein [Hymenobacter sp.]|uniref:hypothetical protein n=1 Tax=Hymenobacter sp. TaxID=1898978 RepID=UPI00286A2328|nr:hypothetical protein [Hymenobacter sp.]
MKIFTLNSWGSAGLLAVAALLLHACAPAQDAPAPSAGVDVSAYVAVGDSYTAGLSAGGLTRASQEYSYPNLLAQQLRLVAADAAFSQPLLEAGSGSGYLTLVDFLAGDLPRTRRVAGQAVRRTVVNPAACGGPDTVRLLTRSATAAALPQNLGVPGLLLSQIETANLGNESAAVPGGNFNSYFERLLPAASNRTYLQAVTDVAASATFFTYFQGLDDLMPYVRSGGECGPLPNTTLTNQLRANARKVLDRLTADGRPGIIAKLPALTSLPILRLGRGLDLQTRLQARFGDNALLYIEDPLGFRPAQPITNSDYVLATALPRVGQLTPVQVGAATLMLPYGRDARNPLRDADVLDDTQEFSRIKGVLDSYNDELERLAKDVYKLPAISTATGRSTLDLDEALFNQVAGGISVGGVVYSMEPVRGNFFSLDNYTLTPRGNGLLANAFITAINRAYRANIPAVDVNNLPTTAQ